MATAYDDFPHLRAVRVKPKASVQKRDVQLTTDGSALVAVRGCCSFRGRSCRRDNAFWVAIEGAFEGVDAVVD